MLETGRLNRDQALAEMTQEDLRNFWLLWKLEPWGARSWDKRLGTATGAITERHWFEIFPGYQGENVPQREPAITSSEHIDKIIAYWDINCRSWNNTKG